MAFPFGGGLALIRPQFGRSIRIGGVGTPVYGTSSQFEPSGVARFRTQPDDGAVLSPTFSVDWTASTSLPAAISLSRASSGTYFDSSGVLQTATSNTPRFDYKYNGTSWVEAGLLIEEQRTNFVTTHDFSSWLDPNPGSKTISTATGLDGSSTSANSIVCTVTSSPKMLYTSAGAPTTASPVTMSVYVKPNGYTQYALRESAITGAAAVFTLTGSGSVFGTYNAGAVTVSGATVTNIGAGWYRISAVFTSSGSQGWWMGLLVMDGGYTSGDPFSYSFTGDNTSGGTYFAPQMEIGTGPTSVIYPVSSAVTTRSADIVSSTDATLLAAQAWVVEVGELVGSTAATLLGINTVIGLGATSGNALTTGDGGSQTTANTGTWTGQNRGGIAWDSTPRVSIDLDGGTVVTAANTPATPTALYFGNTNNGAADFLNGHLRMMAAYAAVTDSQLVTISAVGAPFSGSVSTDNAALAATESADIAAFAASVTINAALAATEAADTAAIAVSVGDNAALAATEAQDVALINASETDVAVLAATEAKDTAVIAVSVGDNAALAATEAQDVAAINASVGDRAALAVTEAQDVALINASESDVAVLAVTEAQDVAAFIVAETDAAVLAATETADVAAVNVTVGATIAVLAATESQDVSRLSVAVTQIVIPPDPRPSHGLRRIYPAAGVPGVYGADIFGGGASGTTPDFKSGDFKSSDFPTTGTPATAGSGASIYGAAGALNKPLRRTSGPQMRRTYKYPVQLIPGGIYDKDIYGENIYQSDS